MVKKLEKRQGDGEPPANLHDWSIWRAIVESPGAEMARFTKLIAGLQQDLSTDLAEGPPGRIPSDPFRVVQYAHHVHTRILARLEIGKAEAEAIRSHLEAFDVGTLRHYLKDHPATVECLVWLLAENRRLSLAVEASKAASRAASKKNEAAREFVNSAWAARSESILRPNDCPRSEASIRSDRDSPTNRGVLAAEGLMRLRCPAAHMRCPAA